MLNRFLRDRRGATAIEYSMIAAFIAIAIIAALTSIGVSLEGIFVAVTQGFTATAP